MFITFDFSWSNIFIYWLYLYYTINHNIMSKIPSFNKLLDISTNNFQKYQDLINTNNNIIEDWYYTKNSLNHSKIFHKPEKPKRVTFTNNYGEEFEGFIDGWKYERKSKGNSYKLLSKLTLRRKFNINLSMYEKTQIITLYEFEINKIILQNGKSIKSIVPKVPKLYANNHLISPQLKYGS